jgi:exonuclease SbcC
LTDEETFLGARLSSPEREKLDSAQRRLDNEKTQVTSLLENKGRELELEKAKNLTSEDETSLGELLAKTQAPLKEIGQTIGAHQHRLAENSRLRVEKAEKIKAFEKQRAKLSRVEKLNSLIGQADGRKFREYAQSLTFEYLVQKANRQLAKMSGRYLLCQDKEHILEFNVMDNFQAGEIRSTKNLSGGESFLVSLALALGLSMMASENVEVNSLFLDEGFGTLDEDALDMALSALGQLPQSEGKTIGLISHVEALKERISTQIKIVPRSGGQSLLTGPGCRRLNSA